VYKFSISWETRSRHSDGIRRVDRDERECHRLSILVNRSCGTEVDRQDCASICDGGRSAGICSIILLSCCAIPLYTGADIMLEMGGANDPSSGWKSHGCNMSKGLSRNKLSGRGNSVKFGRSWLLSKLQRS